MRDGLRIDPAYFFDDYEGDRDFRVYLLSEKRAEKRLDAFEARLATLERSDVELRGLLLAEREENERLRTQLARRGRSTTQPPSLPAPRR